MMNKNYSKPWKKSQISHLKCRTLTFVCHHSLPPHFLVLIVQILNFKKVLIIIYRHGHKKKKKTHEYPMKGNTFELELEFLFLSTIFILIETNLLMTF